ncbi:uncharacterized protein [Canis lupus baileyi]|uniref:uncharacterized protein n=1 Tax=Canis lupus baileyi TaxID=143281 RepID=UPI003B96EFFE
MAPRSKKKRPAAARTPGPARPGPALGTAAGAGAPARCLGVGRELQPRRLLYLRAGGKLGGSGDLAAAAGPLPASPPPRLPSPPRRPPPSRPAALRGPARGDFLPRPSARGPRPRTRAQPRKAAGGDLSAAVSVPPGVDVTAAAAPATASTQWVMLHLAPVPSSDPSLKPLATPKTSPPTGLKRGSSFFSRKSALSSEKAAGRRGTAQGLRCGPRRLSCRPKVEDPAAVSSLPYPHIKPHIVTPKGRLVRERDAFLITSSETLLEDLHSGPKELEREEKKTRKEQSENKEEIKREKKECEESERGS